jgi:hypothetical protein
VIRRSQGGTKGDEKGEGDRKVKVIER